MAGALRRSQLGSDLVKYVFAVFVEFAKVGENLDHARRHGAFSGWHLGDNRSRRRRSCSNHGAYDETEQCRPLRDDSKHARNGQMESKRTTAVYRDSLRETGSTNNYRKAKR